MCGADGSWVERGALVEKYFISPSILGDYLGKTVVVVVNICVSGVSMDVVRLDALNFVVDLID